MDDNGQEKVKFYFVVALVSAFILTSLTVLGFYMYYGFTTGLWLRQLEDHFATLVVIPFGAGCALVVVVLLRATQGPIEFEGLGFKFKGASGPIILWCIAFLAFITAVRILW